MSLLSAFYSVDILVMLVLIAFVRARFCRINIQHKQRDTGADARILGQCADHNRSLAQSHRSPFGLGEGNPQPSGRRTW